MTTRLVTQRRLRAQHSEKSSGQGQRQLVPHRLADRNDALLDDDDPQERMRILNRGNRWRGLCLQASTAIATDPVTVRIDLDPR